MAEVAEGQGVLGILVGGLLEEDHGLLVGLALELEVAEVEVDLEDVLLDRMRDEEALIGLVDPLELERRTCRSGN